MSEFCDAFVESMGWERMIYDIGSDWNARQNFDQTAKKLREVQHTYVGTDLPDKLRKKKRLLANAKFNVQTARDIIWAHANQKREDALKLAPSDKLRKKLTSESGFISNPNLGPSLTSKNRMNDVVERYQKVLKKECELTVPQKQVDSPGRVFQFALGIHQSNPEQVQQWTKKYYEKLAAEEKSGTSYHKSLLKDSIAPVQFGLCQTEFEDECQKVDAAQMTDVLCCPSGDPNCMELARNNPYMQTDMVCKSAGL